MISQHSTPSIIAKAFKDARESQGLSYAQLAELTYLSERQIREIEEDGNVCFYSVAIKLQAAKKLARILKLDEGECFDLSHIKSCATSSELTHVPGESSNNIAEKSLLQKIKRWIIKA